MPRLEADHRVTSNPSDEYNCVAWVDRDVKHWWEPEIHWPRSIPFGPPEEPDLEPYIALFESWGFELCEDGGFEVGVLKIALYTKDGFFHHVAKQVPPIQWWSSKMGPDHDLRHAYLESLYEAGRFQSAEVTHFMRRPHDPNDDFALEIHGLLLP